MYLPCVHRRGHTKGLSFWVRRYMNVCVVKNTGVYCLTIENRHKIAPSWLKSSESSVMCYAMGF